jgi:hypothetical protein
MTFFNQKEEVLEIEMTPYGKTLFSQGRFKPEYYAFFDDDVLYDSQYAGFTEVQNNAQPRIKDGTPRDHVQYLFSGVESQVGKNVYYSPGDSVNSYAHSFTKPVDERKMPAIPETDRNYAFYAPLGKSDYTSNKMPAWNIKFWEGELSSSVPYALDPYPGMRIPQLSSSLEYTISFSREFEQAIKTIKNIEDVVDIKESLTKLLGPQGLGSSISELITVEEETLLLEILEDNAVYSNKNFDIEVYMVETTGDSEKTKGSHGSEREILIPLSFEKRVSNIKNDILLSPSEIPVVDPLFIASEDPSYVEHYFDISIDREIPKSQMRRSVKRRSSKGYFIDSTTFRDATVSSILQTDIGDGEG